MSLSSYAERAMSRRVLRGFSREHFAATRARAGLSVSDLARRASVAVSTIHHWEAGTRTPQIDILAAVMTVLGAPIASVVLVDADQRYPSDLRVVRGLTQPQLAAAAGLTTAAVARIERADAPLSDTNAALIARVVGVDVHQYRAAYQRARTRPAGTPP